MSPLGVRNEMNRINRYLDAGWGDRMTKDALNVADSRRRLAAPVSARLHAPAEPARHVSTCSSASDSSRGRTPRQQRAQRPGRASTSAAARRANFHRRSGGDGCPGRIVADARPLRSARALTLCSIGSHSALDVAFGARACGLRNLIVTARGREQTYARHFARRDDPPRGCVDEVLELERLRRHPRARRARAAARAQRPVRAEPLVRGLPARAIFV